VGDELVARKKCSRRTEVGLEGTHERRFTSLRAVAIGTMRPAVLDGRPHVVLGMRRAGQVHRRLPGRGERTSARPSARRRS